MPLNARRIMDRCDSLARHTEHAGKLTRLCFSNEQRAASDEVLGWMRRAGMQAHVDAIGNVIGRYEGVQGGLPSLLLGSHLDTVRDAGRYDGMLGVIIAIECVQAFADCGKRFPFAIEIAGFCDEEGVRFGTTLLGSRALAGSFDYKALESRDRDGATLAQALRDFGLDPSMIGNAAKKKFDIHAYIELHIEQGPVLESLGLPLGLVTAINGFSRLRVKLTGRAGHAGTVPMHLRRDALAAAAECVLAVERIGRGVPDLVATVGRLEVNPGAINVIPGEVSFTLDVRSPSDSIRGATVLEIIDTIQTGAKKRQIEMDIETLQEQNVTTCATWLTTQLEQSLSAENHTVHLLPSGAGHDGMAMQAIADIAMLFVRCKEGISHHPAEAIAEADALAGARVLARFIENFKVPGP